MKKSAKLAVQPAPKPEASEPLRIDLGCGPHKQAGFLGVDAIKFPGVDQVVDLRKPWPWKDQSVDEIHCSHFLEHLDGMERVHFANEVYRVLKPTGKATIICPHAFSERAYGDVTHKWPPFVSFWFYYLDKDWRAANAPHNDFYTCNLDCRWGNSLHPEVAQRDQNFQAHAQQFFKEAIQDIHVTMTRKP